MHIRPARPADREALLAISLATGDAGGDAAPLHRDGELIGLVYSAPYLALAPELALVAEDEAGVVGFAVGAADTRAFEARLERDWWPALRAAYPCPTGDPSSWDADARRIARFHAPRRVPDAVVAGHPAHLHLNLLDRARGRGVGRRLLAAWCARLAAEAGASPGLHVGVNPRNAGGLAFWVACGFRPIEAPEALADASTTWLGRGAG